MLVSGGVKGKLLLWGRSLVAQSADAPSYHDR